MYKFWRWCCQTGDDHTENNNRPAEKFKGQQKSQEEKQDYSRASREAKEAPDETIAHRLILKDTMANIQHNTELDKRYMQIFII